MRIGTKGVVRLFNAIRMAQSESNVEPEEDGKQKRSRETFLDKLKAASTTGVTDNRKHAPQV